MKKINSEEPDIHWRFMNPKGKIVLDLGCGKFYSSISTAEWFINNGAKLVVGVDLADIDLDRTNFVMHAECIASTEQLINLIYGYMPEVIKCDIEGAERYLEDMEALPTVGEIAIEYHDAVTKEICERKLKEWGFQDIELYQLFDESIDRIGVIHGTK